MWIALEGIDGVGKTAVMKQLVTTGFLSRIYNPLEAPLPAHGQPVGVVDTLLPLPESMEGLPRAVHHLWSRMRWTHRVPASTAVVLADRCWLSNRCYAPKDMWAVLAPFEAALPQPDHYIILRRLRVAKPDDPAEDVITRAQRRYDDFAAGNRAVTTVDTTEYSVEETARRIIDIITNLKKGDCR